MNRTLRRRLLAFGLMLLVLTGSGGLVVVGCTVLAPLPPKSSVAERIAAFPTRDLPLQAPATIYWDRHMIPFIETEHDADLAFLLGMVHAHLRLGQLTMLKRLVYGRTAEMFGPPAVKVDHALRVLNLPRAARETHRAMPPETRAWLGAFVKGLNFYQDHAAALPHEFRVLALRPEPWTPEDIIALERLWAVDVNWFTAFGLLGIRGRPYYRAVFERLLEMGAGGAPSFRYPEDNARLGDLLEGHSGSGSNALAVSARRSATGGALLAGDTHLGILFPNPWIVGGYRSPSYHVVGLMAAGLPFVMIGRNRHLAWGGTNMRAATSDLYDVSGQPLAERTERLRVRWWRDRTLTVRESSLGPVISDIPFLKDYGGPSLALRWTGHDPTDDLTGILRANRARDWPEFVAALSGGGVSGMNVLYADAEGHIAQVLVVRLPVRTFDRPPDLVLDAADPSHRWQGFRTAADLPRAFDPKRGFLVSCNNTPVKMRPPVGYFPSSDDRVRRITALLEARPQTSVESLRAIQRDVYSITDVALRDLFLEKMQSAGVREALERDHPRLLAALSAWDGRYTPESTGAVAFQAFLYHAARAFYRRTGSEERMRFLLGSGRARAFLLEDLRAADPGGLGPLLREAAAKAAGALDDFPDWGAMHRLRVAHVLSNLPLVGRRYRFGDYPAAGANETVLKTAHRLGAGRSVTRFGSNARYLHDLADADANDFVLLGGQDGWLNSDASLDQVPLWLTGDYLRVPLRLESVRRWAAFRLDLKPGAAR